MQIITFTARADRINTDVQFWLDQHPNAKIYDCQVTFGPVPPLSLVQGLHSQGLEALVKPFVFVVIFYEEDLQP